MALNVTIIRTNPANVFTAGSTVATIYASGGTPPYAYKLATGGDYFKISGTNIQVKADMNIDSIQSFSITVTDSTSPAEEYTSEVMYPRIYATSIQNKFNKTNTIYKITQDIDLGHGILTVPSGCTLDFQGGSFSNGTIQGNNTNIQLTKIGFSNIVFQGTYANKDFYITWVDYNNILDVQSLIDCAIDNRIDFNLDNVEFSPSTPLYIDRRYTQTENNDKYFVVKNGTIAISTNTLISTRIPVTQYPMSQYVKLEDIRFINNTNSNVYVLDSIKFMRIRFNNCSFDNVGLSYSTEHYIQSYYIYNCFISNMQYDWFTANDCYDFHFINNSVESSLQCVLLNISCPRGVFIIGNLIESIKSVIHYVWANGLSIIGNYIELSTTTPILGRKQTTGNVGRGTTIIGNRFRTDPSNDNVILNDDGKYYTIQLGYEKDFLILGNAISAFSNLQEILFIDSRSYGFYSSPDNEEQSDYLGLPSVSNIMNILGKGENIGKLNVSGILFPASNDPSLNEGGSGYVSYPDQNSPFDNGYNNRAIVENFNSKTGDKLIRLTTASGNKDAFPQMYIKAHYSYNDEDTKWIKIPSLLTSHFGSDFLDDDLVLTPQNNGTFRFQGDTGLEYWNGQEWCRPDGYHISVKLHGNTENRPLSTEGIKTGFRYFDTTLNKPIWWNGTKWIDATGTEV